MKTVALDHVHERLGGRMCEFAGYRLPVDYGSVIQEVKAARTAAGVFDVSHMARLTIHGEGSLDALQKLLTNDVSKLTDGGCQYTLMCQPDGGVIDDLIVCRESADRFPMVVNASNHEKDCAWMAEHLPGSVSMIDHTAQTTMLAIQGPNAIKIVVAAGMPEAEEIGRFRYGHGKIAGIEVMAARTGYTGEDGFEITCQNSKAEKLWDALMSAGAELGLKPCGLAARDVLRIEAALPLYGHEIDDKTNPAEAGLNRWLKPDKGDFIGREPIADMLTNGVPKKLVGIRMTVRAVPRAEDVVTCAAGEGVVTSGTFSPTLGAGIAMAYMPPSVAVDMPVELTAHGKTQPGVVCALPFYKRGK